MIVKLTLSSPEQPEDREIWIHAAHIVHFAADARGGTFLRTTKPEPLWCSESPDTVCALVMAAYAHLRF